GPPASRSCSACFYHRHRAPRVHPETIIGEVRVLPASAMRLDETRFADVVVLGPIGRVDHVTAEELKTALAPHLARCGPGHDHVVLDFAGVDYISSAGLRVLMLAAKQVK